MAYTADKPKIAHDPAELRSRIPGWGVDVDPKNRPGVPKEQFNLANGAHWTFPERQIEKYPRERSIEHAFLTPVFGTAQAPRGLSGAIRRLAYRRYSEGQSAHWLLLMLADRVDVIESAISGLFRGRPDNVLAEWGVKSELTRHGIRSRFGRNRADVKRLPVDLLGFAATAAVWGVGVWALIGGTRYVARQLT